MDSHSPAKTMIDQTIASILPLLKEQTFSPTERVTVPEILAHLLAAFDHDPRELGHYTLERAFDLYAGKKVMGLLDDLLWLNATLIQHGYTTTRQFDFGYADRYAYTLHDAPDLKAFACQTQNINYLVVLAQRHGDWTIHLRRWWEPVASPAGEHYKERFQAIKRKTFQDVVVHASEAAERFSDHLPGVQYVRRPDLAMYDTSGYVVGMPHSCPGLRYGDMRDAGYLLSVKQTPFGIPKGDEVLITYRRLKYVLYDMISAIDTFRELDRAATSSPPTL